MTPLKESGLRFIRNALGLLIAGVVAKYEHDARWLVVGPILNAVAKYVRANKKLWWIPL